MTQAMKPGDRIIFEDIERAIEGLDLSPLKNARVLLLGASGLMGAYLSYLIYHLNTKLGFGIEVDLYTKNPISPDSRLAFLAEEKGIHFLQHDASQQKTYDKKYDFMVHSAGYSPPAFFLKDPIKTIDLNYVGMKSILESAVQYSPSVKILYVSSSEIYGSPTEGNFPTPETYPGNVSVTNNRACYMESKRLAEVLCLAYASAHNLHVRIARPALFYGPGMTMDDGRVIGQFIGKAYRDKKISMVDDGRDLRCFCYVADAMRQLLAIMLYSKDTIYNVGSEAEEVTIFDLAKTIGEYLGVPVVPGPGKDATVAGAPSRVHLDMRKFQKEFNMPPQVLMEEGLRRTIDWNLALLGKKRGN